MRKMLNTLFVTTEDAYLSLENENIVVHVGEEKRAQYPLLMLEGILTFSYKGASPALMGACAERGIGLTFLTPRGRFLARVCGSERGNVLLRREQYRRADSLSASCLIARNFIFGKVYNQRWVLERTIRDHALRVNVQALKDVSAALDAKLPQIESAVDLGLPLIIAPKPSTSSPPTQSFEKKRNSSALFAREINLVTQPSFDCEQGINSQVQTVCSNADAVFSVLGIVFCKNERFSLLRKTHVPLWNEPRISHVRLP